MGKKINPLKFGSKLTLKGWNFTLLILQCVNTQVIGDESCEYLRKISKKNFPALICLNKIRSYKNVLFQNQEAESCRVWPIQSECFWCHVEEQ